MERKGKYSQSWLTLRSAAPKNFLGKKGRKAAQESGLLKVEKRSLSRKNDGKMGHKTCDGDREDKRGQKRDLAHEEKALKKKQKTKTSESQAGSRAPRPDSPVAGAAESEGNAAHSKEKKTKKEKKARAIVTTMMSQRRRRDLERQSQVCHLLQKAVAPCASAVSCQTEQCA